MRKCLYAAFVVVLVGCSSSSSGTSPGANGPGGDAGKEGGALSLDGGPIIPVGVPDGDVPAAGCTYTISGAATATGTCSIDAAYSSSDGGVGFILTTSDPSAAIFEFGGTLVGQTALQSGTYTLAESPEAGAEFATGAGTVAWDMCNNGGCADGMGNTIPNQGSFTLVISDPGPNTQGLLWMAPHGTLSIVMPAVPNTGGSGTVMANVTF